jgi:hypothetical protein
MPYHGKFLLFNKSMRAAADVLFHDFVYLLFPFVRAAHFVSPRAIFQFHFGPVFSDHPQRKITQFFFKPARISATDDHHFISFYGRNIP